MYSPLFRLKVGSEAKSRKGPTPDHSASCPLTVCNPVYGLSVIQVDLSILIFALMDKEVNEASKQMGRTQTFAHSEKNCMP